MKNTDNLDGHDTCKSSLSSSALVHIYAVLLSSCPTRPRPDCWSASWVSPRRTVWRPGDTSCWPAWLPPGRPRHFPSTWWETSTPRSCLSLRWFSLPAVLGQTLQKSFITRYSELGEKKTNLWAVHPPLGEASYYWPDLPPHPAWSLTRETWETEKLQHSGGQLPFLLDCSFFIFTLSSNPLISSGQSRFSRGSQVFSSGPKPCISIS